MNNYYALYRKYRPDTLDDVVGQNIIVKTLKNSISKNHISHAYLFTGPRGTGKTSIAKILAKTINCYDLNGTTPCDKCVSCTQINLKQNVDIIEIDAASNNGVDEIREIRNKVNLVPSISKYKVYIIDEVHMLTTGAFNALLKTLEEPPSHIVFILATTEPHKIPITILSRCQRFDFKRISDKDILSRLNFICEQENINITEEALKEIAVSSDGGMRDAISILDQVIAYAETDISIEDVHAVNGTIGLTEISCFIDMILNKNLDLLLEKVETYNQNGKNLTKIAEEMVIFLKNILIYKQAPHYFEQIQSHLSEYEKYKEIDDTWFIEIIEAFNEYISSMKKSSMPKFLFELLIIKILRKNSEPDVKVGLNKEIDKQEKTINVIESIKEPKIPKQNSMNAIKQVEPEYDYTDIQERRIENTLSRFDKKELLKIKEQLEPISSLLIDPDKSQYVSIILDGVLKAASDEYAIFIYEHETDAYLFNSNISKIESIVEEFVNKKYKLIATHNDSWEVIKKDFNNKKRMFEYKEETEDMLLKLNKNDKDEPNEIDDLFGESVQYES